MGNTRGGKGKYGEIRRIEIEREKEVLERVVLLFLNGHTLERMDGRYEYKGIQLIIII